MFHPIFNVPQTSVIIFSNNYSAYAIYGGSINCAARGAAPLMYWTAIQGAKMKNVNKFDFVGAKLLLSPILNRRGCRDLKAVFVRRWFRDIYGNYNFQKNVRTRERL